MSMVQLRRSGWMQACRLGLAAWVAFAVATALGIEHAFWASMPVWVVAQPWRGVTFERAIWRFLGTLCGGVVGLLLLQYSPSPWTTALIMAIIVGAGVGLTHIWWGVKTYFPLMAGITVAVVVIPSLLDAAEGVSLALDRLSCTFIGVISVTLIVGLFTPRANRNGFRDEVLQFAEDARMAALHLVEGKEAGYERLLHKAADLEGRARLVAAGSARGYRGLRGTDNVLGAAIALLEAAGAVRAQYKTSEAATKDAIAVLNRTATLPIMYEPVLRLATALAELTAAGTSVEAGSRIDHTTSAELGFALPPRRNVHRAGMIALLAFGSSLAGSVAIIWTRSFSAELTAFSIMIFAMILGSMPAPHLLARKVAIGVLVGVLAGMFYRLEVQPWVSSWWLLVATIAPFMAIGAFARVNQRTAIYALDANMCFMLASQAGVAAAAPRAVIVDSVAMALGTMIMVLCYLVLPRPGRHLIGISIRKLWHDIGLLIQRDPMQNTGWGKIAARRTMNLVIELDKAGETIPGNILAFNSLGHAVNHLRRVAADCGKAVWVDTLVHTAMAAEDPACIWAVINQYDDPGLN